MPVTTAFTYGDPAVISAALSGARFKYGDPGPSSGSGAVNYNDTLPAAPSGTVNVKWQADAPAANPRNASAYLPVMTGDAGSGGTSGAVPAPPSGASAAGKYLKADGTWTAPSGGGSSGFPFWTPFTLTANLVAPSDNRTHIPGEFYIPSGILVDLSASTGRTLLEVW